MKILLTAFNGKFNSSNMLINMLDDNFDKLVLTNSFEKLEKELNNTALEEYDLILMFGINKFLKDEIRLEKTARLAEMLNSNLDIAKLKLICEKHIKTIINNVPTRYLCNSAYYHVLKRNKNVLFIHIPGFSKISNMNMLTNMIYDLTINK